MLNSQPDQYYSLELWKERKKKFQTDDIERSPQYFTRRRDGEENDNTIWSVRRRFGFRFIESHDDLAPEMSVIYSLKRVLHVGELVNVVERDDDFLLFSEPRQFLYAALHWHEIAPSDRWTLKYRSGQNVRNDQIVCVFNHAAKHAVRIGIVHNGTAESDERRQWPRFQQWNVRTDVIEWNSCRV